MQARDPNKLYRKFVIDGVGDIGKSVDRQRRFAVHLAQQVRVADGVPPPSADCPVQGREERPLGLFQRRAKAARHLHAHSAIFRPQEALITGECRGGFGIGELVAFLYARTFPKDQWRERFEEALRGMSI